MRETLRRLAFFAACAALLCLGVAVGVERGECVKIPEQFVEPDPKPKPPKPKPSKPKPTERESSEESKPSNDASNVITSSSGRFTKDSQGIIKDKQTGLQWYVGPDSDTNWNQAQSWAQSLSVGGGGWRSPTRSELRSLYGTGSVQGVCDDGKAYEFKVEPIFGSGCWVIWSSEIYDSSSAWYFTFSPGEENWYYRGNSNYLRAFAVRSR